MKYKFFVCRNPNNFRLRKWVVEMIMIDEKTNNYACVDRRYFFGFGNVEGRLERKINRMISKRQEIDNILPIYN